MHYKMLLGELGCKVKCCWVSWVSWVARQNVAWSAGSAWLHDKMQLGQLGQLGCMVKCCWVSWVSWVAR